MKRTTPAVFAVEEQAADYLKLMERGKLWLATVRDTKRWVVARSRISALIALSRIAGITIALAQPKGRGGRRFSRPTKEFVDSLTDQQRRDLAELLRQRK